MSNDIDRTKNICEKLQLSFQVKQSSSTLNSNDTPVVVCFYELNYSFNGFLTKRN